MSTTNQQNGDQSWLSLKSRIKAHYDLCSTYYYSLWGEHIHHGYFPDDEPKITKEAAQIKLIEILLSRSNLEPGSSVLDVGCGLGGTSRYLAREHGCRVTGISISDEQIRMAKELSKGLLNDEQSSPTGREGGWVSFAELAARGQSGGKLVLADWFKHEGLTEKEFNDDVRPIEHGMLLPPLCTQSEYVALAKAAGFKVYAEPLDISKYVAKTWDISIGLVASPSLWALAFTQGKDFIAFLQAFNAMRTGYHNGTFRYAVMVFEAP